MKVSNRSTHDVDLDDGRVLAPGATADGIEETDRISGLLDDGALADVDEEDPQSADAPNNADAVTAAAEAAEHGDPERAPAPPAPGMVPAPPADPEQPLPAETDDDTDTGHADDPADDHEEAAPVEHDDADTSTTVSSSGASGDVPEPSPTTAPSGPAAPTGPAPTTPTPAGSPSSAPNQES